MLKPLLRHLMALHQVRATGQAFKGKQKRPLDLCRAKRLLCLQMNAIGDAVMTQPAWAAIANAFPGAAVDLVCAAPIAPLFAQDPALRRIHLLTPRRYRAWLVDQRRDVLRLLADDPYDALIDFTALPLTALLCADPLAPPSAGFQRTIGTSAGGIDLGAAYDLTVPYSEQAHIRGLTGSLARALVGTELALPSPRLHLAPETLDRASTLMGRLGLQEKGFILVHPGTKWPPKSWPIPYWQDLLDLLNTRGDLTPFVLGGPADQETVAAILHDSRLQRIPRHISRDICLSAALIRAAKVCVCHDSAPMHLAAALGVPSLALFGPVSPARSLPPEQDGARALYHDLFCSPCTLYYSRDRCRRGLNFCMHGLKPEEVALAVNASLPPDPSGG